MLDGDQLLARFVALEKEAITAVDSTNTQPDAFPYWFASSERMPYWTNAMATLAPIYGDESLGDEAALYEVVIWSRLVFAHVTAGMRGEVDERLASQIPQIVQYFNRRRWLQSAAYPTRTPYLRTMEYVTARFNPQMPPTASGETPIGFELQWRCLFDVQVEQVYY